jgi:uncharacterized protein (TIGR03083 family)
MALDYLKHLRDDSARFVTVLRDAPADARVPTCPDWHADDLLWHLATVQWFWGVVVRDAVADPESLSQPDRPPDRSGLFSFFDEAASLLEAALAETDPSERRWTWAAHDQTAGFIRRRQAHEALIHRIDAELTAGVEHVAIDADLAADGIDEVLRFMYGGVPPWSDHKLDPAATLRIQSLDREQVWFVTFGSFSGTSPGGHTYTGSAYLEVEDAGPDRAAAAGLVGSSADLDCWLWGRPTIGSIERSGDPAVHARLEEIIADGIA